MDSSGLVLGEFFGILDEMDYYMIDTLLTTPIGNNRIDFEERKKLWSDCCVRIPPLIQGTIHDIKIVVSNEWWNMSWLAYEYVDEKGRLIRDVGLEYLVEIKNWEWEMNSAEDGTGSQEWKKTPIYIIDNHNHAFYCRWKSYLAWYIARWSRLIHIDQHSDLNLPTATIDKLQAIGEWEIYNLKFDAWSTLKEVAIYTNETLDIASFIKPAKEIGLISDYEIILTEYSLVQYQIPTLNPQPNTLILDIDLDFRAPEMSITAYDTTIKKVRQLIALPDVWCVTIATSPTYISQQRALEVLRDLVG